ncbi:MAG TPA: M50 family metallopeptidase [Longimicrobiales bacterium]
MQRRTHRRIGFLVAFAAYFAALWLLWETPVVYPIKLFVVLLHELSHAAAALATGGSVERIVLSANEGGATWTRGGNPFITLSAGYLGSLACGLVLLAAARMRAARVGGVLTGLGILLLATAALYVRNGFGLTFCLLSGIALILAARWLAAAAQAMLLTTLGLTSALYAVLDIRSDIFRHPHLDSDARLLADLTGVPTLVWGTLWMAAACAACWIAFRRALRRA